LKAVNAAIWADHEAGLVFHNRIVSRTYSTIEVMPRAGGTPVDRVLKRFYL
jgi:hypothetical protein